ncbi:MAG: serpin family protein [Planctomycetota bacterium]
MTRTMTFRKLIAILVAIVFMGPIARAGDDDNAAADSKGADDVPQIVQASNAFAWKLYAQVTKDKEENVFFSPSSIHTALTMTYAGAAGLTAEQMYEALSLPDEEVNWGQQRTHQAYRGLLAAMATGKKARYQLNIANALWGQKGYSWQEEFLALTGDNYGAGLRQVDFKTETEPARKTINGWVEDQTADKIKNLLAPGTVKMTTRLVLTNAVYFKGDWAKQFKESRTRDEPFKLSAKKTVKVPMMNQTDDFELAHTELAQILRMKYAGDDVSMIVVLPKAIDGLAETEAWLAKEGLDSALEGLREIEVMVAMPKFTMSWQAGLSNPLKALGMTDAFEAAKADFSGLSDQAKSDGLCIDFVVHKAFVDVNEEGTEAAAATGVGFGITSMPPSFRADHPFVFVIRHDKTGAILFVGRMMNPQSGKTDEASGSE